MAGQPNMNAMMKQVQKMQADMAKAQEELKNEVVEASAGGGMVTVKVSGDLELTRDHGSTRRPWTPRTSRCSRTWCSAAVNEALRSAQELAAIEDERGGRRPRRAGRPGRTRPTRLLGTRSASGLGRARG